MTIVTIPRSHRSLPRGEYVLVPKTEYEELIERARAIPVVKMTAKDRRDSKRADREIKAGKYYPLSQVRHELERFHNRKRKTTA